MRAFLYGWTIVATYTVRITLLQKVMNKKSSFIWVDKLLLILLELHRSIRLWIVKSFFSWVDKLLVTLLKLHCFISLWIIESFFYIGGQVWLLKLLELHCSISLWIIESFFYMGGQVATQIFRITLLYKIMNYKELVYMGGHWTSC